MFLLLSSAVDLEARSGADVQLDSLVASGNVNPDDRVAERMSANAESVSRFQVVEVELRGVCEDLAGIVEEGKVDVCPDFPPVTPR